MQDFKRLLVWLKAHALLLALHQAFRSRRTGVIGGLRSQALRAAASISANIAEGCGKATTKEFIRFLDIATGSSRELENHLIVARPECVFAFPVGRVGRRRRGNQTDAVRDDSQSSHPACQAMRRPTVVRGPLSAVPGLLLGFAVVCGPWSAVSGLLFGSSHRAVVCGPRSAVSGLSFDGSMKPRGYTVVELLIVLTIVGTLMALAFPRAQLALDRLSVHAAAVDLSTILASARNLALASHSPVAVDFDGKQGLVRVRRGSEIVQSRNVGQAHGVLLEHSRDSLTYGIWGLARGAANLSVVVRRRAAAETVFVSRLGRVR